jgi:4a-hydroxytetrahydrobiopterin dehydratase
MNNWTENNNELHKTFFFSSFLDAMKWMGKASVEIEKHNHHPKWTNEYNKVHVCLSTHDEGNTITHKDRLLAQALDEIKANGV